MKVTNLETSKKLKEFGFEANTMAFIDPDSEECQIWLNAPEGLIPAYGLETILEALPDHITFTKIYKEELLFLQFSAGGNYFSYRSGLGSNMLVFEKEENESLANTAGRLLVKLLENKIIKLGE